MCLVIWMRRIGILLSVALYLLVAVNSARAAVDLLYFLPVPAVNSILLTWETAQEIDNAGFYIVRSDSQGGTYERISGFIASLDPFVGHYYEYNDTGTAIGVEYFYKLEAVDAGGNSVFYGPVSAMVTAATLTPTMTATGQSTTTSTYTPTATTAVPASTSTPTPAPTLTRTSRPSATATSRPISTSAPTSTTAPASTQVTASPTTTSAPTKVFTPTLEPLPEIQLVFPALTPTHLPARTPTPVAVMLATPVGETTQSGISPRLVFLALVVLVLWLVLVGFVIFYFRHTGR